MPFINIDNKNSAIVFHVLYLAQWLKFRSVNHDIMGSNPAETVYFFILFFVFMYTY